jgi:hypothetical protein
MWWYWREKFLSRRQKIHRFTPPDFYLWGAAKSAVYRDRPGKLNELKAAMTAYTRNISQADLQKVFENKIKEVQACIDTRGHHFQHPLQVHSDFPNALFKEYTSLKQRYHFSVHTATIFS